MRHCAALKKHTKPDIICWEWETIFLITKDLNCCAIMVIWNVSRFFFIVLIDSLTLDLPMIDFYCLSILYTCL